MDPSRLQPGFQRDAEWPIRGPSLRITPEEIARAARELVDAYGAEAIKLMQNRTRAVRRRGDTESARLWDAIGEAVKEQLAAGDTIGRTSGTGD